MSTIDVDREWKLLIGGEWVDPDKGTYEIIDPSTTAVLGDAPEASVAKAEATTSATTDCSPTSTPET